MIKTLNSKSKIIGLVISFALFAIGMFWFGYGIFGNRTQLISDSIAQKRVELEVLQREQKSFTDGKRDLAELAKSAYPPEDLFSKDTKVVKEIQQLESAAQKYGLEMDLAVSGSAKAAVKVPGTTGELFSIPYTITLTGPFQNSQQFIQVVEHMPFITHINNVSISVGVEDETKTILSSEFFIKK